MSLCSAWPLTLKVGPEEALPHHGSPGHASWYASCTWHHLIMMRRQSFSSSFCQCLNSSFSAAGFLLNQLKISLYLSRIFYLSSSLILPSSLSSCLCFHIQCSEFTWISGIHLVSSSHIQLCPSEPLDYMLSVSFAQRALVIFDGDLVLFSCTLMHSRVTWDANGILKLLHWK